MNHRTKFIVLFISLLFTGCASKVDASDPEVIALSISEACKEHASILSSKGASYMKSYGICAQDTLDYLRTIR
jgi:hypothetical protein